ncbi:MAG: eL32 family ribosomal protein [Candidatus Altiarchaeota archaeon]|nr:eL32 family ribosomal protein [Candidatus Altiarchaeota archaeon]
MKDFTDVTPTEKKREQKIQKDKKLEHETKERKKKKELEESQTEKPPEDSAKEIAAEPAAESPSAKAPSKEAVKKPKAKKRKAIPVEKIQFHEKKGVPAKTLRKKKPHFRRQEHSKIRLKPVWRKAIGIDSKQHEGKRGKGKIPGIGYKNPGSLQYTHPLGYKSVLIHNVKELEKIKAQTEGAIIAAAVGRRKRNMIIAEANKLKITILNPRKGEV